MANAQLYSARERSLIQTIVSVMRSYSLSYTANFQDGVTSFIFCPPVDVLVLFPLESSEQRRSGFLSNTVRQMIAHRIQLARIRSEELPLDKENNDQRQYSRRINEQQLSSKNQSPNQASCNAKSAGDGNDNLDRNRIIYRYNQGFSNAIRRNIRMRNLIF
ncbi:unnamed protein product [Anisakis simplex]|uniref:Chromosome transmission fidelity protein 18 homolog (inferred by orthology to a human protein) n=1 Tax=Anisakis simplex TaxID=6269 RepID=A0A0M3J7D0_ANISI|nr:unnamed protein product [Anisakis simplex]